MRFVNRMLFFLIIFIFMGFLWPHSGFAKEINVELVWKLSQASWIEIQIEEGSYSLKQGSSTYKFPPGSKLQLGWGGWAPVQRINEEGFAIVRDNTLELDSTEPGYFKISTPEGKQGSYRGKLKILWMGDHWKLMNIVDEEDYLKGVVPIEMSNQWAERGFEALKAQAVAARTYMVKHTPENQVITDSPNIHQAYLGKDVEGAASLAVDETKKEIMVDAVTRQPIDALYSSHNGGYTEDPKNVWGNENIHYSSHPDPFSRDIGGAIDRWRFIISAPALGKKFELGPISKIELDKFPSGRVKKVRMEDLLGNTISVSGKEFVKTFYPFGQPIRKEAFLGSLFCVKYYKTSNLPGVLENWNAVRARPYLAENMEAGPSLSRIISSSEGITPEWQPFGTYIFYGRGWGHGIGLSQWGAYNMAQQGYSYIDILSFYYDNALLIRPKAQ